MKMNGWRVLLSASVLPILVACAGPEATSRSAESPIAGPAAAPVQPQADAEAILMGMAELLSRTQRFSVNVRSSYDAVQPSGQKIEFGDSRTLTVSRPDRMRVEAERSDGHKQLVLFDGKAITVFSSPRNVYASISRPGNLDEAIAYFMRDLHMRLPLAMLFVSRLPAELERRVQALDYVENTNILGAPAHHLAGQTKTVDFQVWVADGGQPLPQRVVLTYKDAAGEPQFRAQFSDWNLSPEITDSMFAFTPPEGAEKIAFLPQLRAVAVRRKAAPAQSGEQK
ncbi:MAG: DUF2092 domain-containing protein [Pseudomonadota bacterium]|nr:DUF2092 domain-containing protein [Pseudomonadota bacterium]